MLTPRWWLLHAVVLLVAFGMLRLGLWQWHRAHAGNGGLQNYAYAFQWPVFAAFGLFLWVRTMHEEIRRAAHPEEPVRRPMPAVGETTQVVRTPGVRMGLTTQVPDVDDDPEVTARNAALAALNAAAAASDKRRR